MRSRFLLIMLALMVCSCSGRVITDRFVFADQSEDGVYSFPIAIQDSTAAYDAYLYTRVDSPVHEYLKLRIRWNGPEGTALSETVYMDPGRNSGNALLYRKGVIPGKAGDWEVNIIVENEPELLRGMGFILKEDGTR